LSGEELATLLGVKTASDWMRTAADKPVPKMLFGEFWLEGELGVMFADTGKGKSILAVQMAEAIARGNSIEPLKTTARAQTVLYLDFELTEKQFEMRYTEDLDTEAGEDRLRNQHQFSDNFFRAQIDVNGEFPEQFASFEEYLRDAIRKLVKHLSATVLIVDNISFLKRSNEHVTAAYDLMLELKKLKNELGLSILVLAHTPKRSVSKPLTVNDLQGSKILSNFADSVFAIGQSRIESDIRYIKHIKQRSNDHLYDARHVPSFRIRKLGGNFLSFSFMRYTTEQVHLFNYEDAMVYKRVRAIQKFAREGMSQRTIAAEMGISLGSVNRYLQMSYLNRDFVIQYGELDPVTEAEKFPGCDGIDEMIQCTQTQITNSDSEKEEWEHRRELIKLKTERDKHLRQYWITSGKIPAPETETL